MSRTAAQLFSRGWRDGARLKEWMRRGIIAYVPGSFPVAGDRRGEGG
jgi:hypothetical protein